MYTDESEEETEEVDVYRKKYQLIIERCEVIQQDNERLVNRIHQVKKILKRRRKERKFLMDRLDMHGDNWRNVPLPLILEDPNNSSKVSSIKTKTSASMAVNNKETFGKKGSSTGNINSGGGTSGGGSSGINTSSKRKSSKIDKNAPKRPANPFFQFCQEQRNAAVEEMASIGLSDVSKVDVAKHLANKWNMLPVDEKKIYYDMYEKSKERYNADMQLYTMAKNNAEC